MKILTVLTLVIFSVFTLKAADQIVTNIVDITFCTNDPGANGLYGLNANQSYVGFLQYGDNWANNQGFILPFSFDQLSIFQAASIYETLLKAKERGMAVHVYWNTDSAGRRIIWALNLVSNPTR